MKALDKNFRDSNSRSDFSILNFYSGVNLAYPFELHRFTKHYFFQNTSQKSHLYAFFGFNVCVFKLDYLIRVRLNLVINKLIFLALLK